MLKGSSSFDLRRPTVLAEADAAWINPSRVTAVPLNAGSAVASGVRLVQQMGCVGSKSQRTEEPLAPAGGIDGFLNVATEPALLALIKPGARWEDDFQISYKTLGVGKWGTVKMACNKHTGDKVAFKVLPRVSARGRIKYALRRLS